MTSRRPSHSQISTPAGVAQIQAHSRISKFNRLLVNGVDLLSSFNPSSYAPPPSTGMAMVEYQKGPPALTQARASTWRPSSGTSPLLCTSFGSPVLSPSMQSEYSLNGSAHTRSSQEQIITSDNSMCSPTLGTVEIRSSMESEE